MPRLLVLFIVCSMLGLASAQERAALLSIRTEGVEFRRQNTEAWLRLHVGASFPIGTGDSLRTNGDGSAWLDFGTWRWLILGTSLLHIETLSAERSKLNFEQGLFVWAGVPESSFTIALSADDATTLTRLVGAGAAWVSPTAPDFIAAAEGNLTLEHGAQQFTLAANTLYSDGIQRPNAELGAGLLNPPRFLAATLGCPGRVQTTNGEELLVRRGPGNFFERLVLIPNGAEVAILGQTETTRWLRVQADNLIGWVLATAVESNCPATLSLPDASGNEAIPYILNPDAEALALLRPFYGDPLRETFFYRYR